MLLKCSQSEKRSKINGNTKQQRSTGNMKLIPGTIVNPRLPRKTVKGFATKRPSSHLRTLSGVTGREEHRVPIDASDNSNDSGLGFDQHLDVSNTVQSVLRLSEREARWDSEHSEAKRKKLDIKLESDDANDNFSFSHAMNKSHKVSLHAGGLVPECLMPSRGSGGASGMQRPLGGTASGGGGGGSGNTGSAPRGSLARLPSRPMGVASRRPPGPVSLSSPLMGHSRDGRVQLQIASQPEQQHRARYQTEGSRGAVKDRSGNGFPVVKLVGYNKPTTLQVFIGTDMGRVAPHMFYQACKVSGKNSTPCVEKKIDGTIVIEVDFDPTKDMTITCDCVGILKERNVDVEHRFPDQSGTRNKKKSTRCRMIFRTTISHPDGSTEILQTTSQPIVCTQPPGVPEICKKSLSSASCTGGMELFILGKNFLKDTRVVFQQNCIDPAWEETVQPDKEFLQQTHLVCIVPAYQRCDIVEPVTVRLMVTSSGKTSEPHLFTYLPATIPVLQPAAGTTDIPQPCLNLVSSGVSHGCVDLNRVFSKPPLGPPPGLILPGAPNKPPSALLPGLPSQFLAVNPAPARVKKDAPPIRLWTSVPLVGDTAKAEDLKARDNEENKALGLKMMPPPPLLPIARGASSNVLIIPDAEPVMASTELKTEVIDESSQESTQLSPEDLKGIDLRMKPATALVAATAPIATVSDLISTQSPSLATFRQFVSNPSDAPLPTQSGQSVEKYLSHIENPIVPKIGGAGGSSASGGISNCSSSTTAVTAVSSSSASASASGNPPDSSAQEMVINKMCNPEAATNSQFNAPIIYDPSQSQNTTLLNTSLPSSVSETQKIPFGNDLPTIATMPTLYNTTPSVVEKEQQKPQIPDQTPLQGTIASRLLAVGITTMTPADQTKPKYQENSLSDLCSTQPLPSVLLPPVNGTTLPDFPGAISSTAEPPPLNVPTLLSTITNSSNMMETSTSLLFSGSPPQAKNLLSLTDMSHKKDDQLMDNSNKMSNCSSSPSTSSSSTGVLASHTLLSSSATSTENTTLNITAQSGPIGGNLLSASQAESTLTTGNSSRLDAFVSSAIESRILEANCQTQVTEKLNAFSSGNMMSAVSTENAVLASQAQVPLSESLSTNPNTSPPIHVQEMTLNSALSVPAVNSFTLNALPSTQSTAQITQENLILNNTVTAAFNTHLLNAGSGAKVEDASLVVNPVCESSLTLEPVIANGTAPHMMMSNSTCAPPIAMKSIIMSSASTTNDTNLLNSSSTQNCPISGKSIVNSSAIGNGAECISTPSNAPPIAMKTMLLTECVDKPTVMTTAMDVKDILAPASMKEEIALSAVTSHCTSPIAMKKIILDSASIVNSVLPNPTLGVKSMLDSQPAESLLAASVPHVSLSTEKLDALVESTVDKHILSTSPVQSPPTTCSMNIENAIRAPTNSLPLTTQSLATMMDSNLQTSLSNNASLSGASAGALLPASESRELHSSASISSIENSNGALASPQETATGILSSQSQSLTGSSLIMFSAENETVKNETLNSVPAVSTSSLLNHHLSMFGPQTAVSVHTLLSPTQNNTNAQALSHSMPFTSTNSNLSGLMSGTPCTLATKISGVTPTPHGEQAQARLLNESFMVLATGESGKNQLNVISTQDIKGNKEEETPRFGVANPECKMTESGNITSCSPTVTKLDVQIHLQQQQKLQSMSDQGKQNEHKDRIVSNAPLPVPVADISTARQTPKDSATIQGPTQKKLEEGMVPQELTQMSESDLLSYINPSCFDQV